MSNELAAGNAQTPGEQPNQNGQQPNGAPDADPNNQPDPAGDGGDPNAGADAGDGGGDTPGGAPPPEQKPNFVPQPRFDEVVAERNAAMDYGNYWREQATKFQQQQPPGAGGAPGAGQPPGGGAAPDPQPLLADFNFDATKWAPKHAEWVQREVARQASTIVDQRLSSRDQQQEAATTANNWQSRVQAFRQSNPDFDQVTSNPTLPITKEMAAIIMRSEVGPAVYHHLGKNPTEAARIARMHPAQQQLAIARLEGRLEAAAPRGGTPPRNQNGQFQGQPRQQSGAPPPPNPVRQGAGGDRKLEDLPLDDYVLRRMEERAGKRK